MTGVHGQSPWPYLLLALTSLRFLVCFFTPLSPDEAYYWVWSRALAFGYFEHPPMVALLVWAGTAIAGDGALGVRLLAPVSAALGSVLIWRAGEDLLPGRGAGLRAAVLLNATLLFGIGAVTMTPDTPLLLFWVAALCALGRVLATGREMWWWGVGAAVGLALDSKYTAGLLPVGIFGWLLTTPSVRPWLRRKVVWAAASLALLLFLPVLWWNAAHGWVSLLKQGARLPMWNPARGPQFVGELLGGQFGLATPGIAVLCVAGVVAAWRTPGRGLLAWLALLPAAVFLEHALAGDRVQGNWPAVLYPSAALAAAGLSDRWRGWLWSGVAVGAVVTSVVWLQGVAAPLALPVRADPTLLRLAGWQLVAAGVSAALDPADGFVAAGNYGQAAQLARLMPPDIPVYGVDARWALFELPRVDGAGRTGLLLGDPDPAAWASVVPLGEIARMRNGMTAERLRLYRVTGRPNGTPIVTMPRPP